MGNFIKSRISYSLKFYLHTLSCHFWLSLCHDDILYSCTHFTAPAVLQLSGCQMRPIKWLTNPDQPKWRLPTNNFSSQNACLIIPDDIAMSDWSDSYHNIKTMYFVFIILIADHPKLMQTTQHSKSNHWYQLGGLLGDPGSVGNSHRSARPRPTALEEDRELLVAFSSILCLGFEI